MNHESAAIFSFKGKKKQSENDLLSDTLLTSVVQPTQLRCHILFPAGFWLFLIWEPRESNGNRWNAVLCSAEWSSIQFLCNFPPHPGTISLAWLRWEPDLKKKEKKLLCVFVGKISHKSVLSTVDYFLISWPLHILCCILLSLSLPSCC